MPQHDNANAQLVTACASTCRHGVVVLSNSMYSHDQTPCNLCWKITVFGGLHYVAWHKMTDVSEVLMAMMGQD
jgi:hypothetical protein